MMQREIRFSLQTEQRQQALASALILIAKLPKHLIELRRMAEKTVKFSELKIAYMKSLTYRPTGGNKKPPVAKTIEEYNSSIDFFITVMGDLKIGGITRETAGEYFSILKKLPANISRVSKYKGRSIQELIAMNEIPQSEVSISKKIERISTMFKWALEEKRLWGIDANPFTGYGQSNNAQSKRRAFKNEELAKLLNHPNFISRTFRSSYSFWLIPLALFTGARLGELCQLDLKDFIEVDGIPCIDINDIDAVEIQIEEGGKRKRVKNNNAKRLVPIHSELIRIGLLRYVEKLQKQGNKHLFTELNRGRRDGAGHAASNWFQRFRKNVGLSSKQETVFHSFRHFFITSILDNEVPPHMLAPIVGHEAELITGKVYWDVKDASKRKPTIEKFNLSDDLIALIPNVEEVKFNY